MRRCGRERERKRRSGSMTDAVYGERWEEERMHRNRFLWWWVFSGGAGFSESEGGRDFGLTRYQKEKRKKKSVQTLRADFLIGTPKLRKGRAYFHRFEKGRILHTHHNRGNIQVQTHQ